MSDLEEERIAKSLGSISARGGLVTFLSQGLRFSVRMASQILLARLLLPADYGLVAMVSPAVALAALFSDLGLAQAVIIQRRITPSQITALFWGSVVLSSVVGLIVAGLAPIIVDLYREPRLGLITLSYAALIPFSGLATIPAALVTRNMRYGVLAVGDVLAPALGLTAGLAAAVAHASYWALVIAGATETVTGAVFIIVASGWLPSRPRYDPAIWSVFSAGGHITGFNIASFITTTTDNIMLGLTYGATALGLYDKGYRTVTQPIQQLISPFGRVAVLMLSRVRDDDSRYREAFRRLTQLMLMGATPGVLATMLFSPLIVTVLLGTRWMPIAPIISWLSLGAIGSPIYACASWLFISQARTRQQLKFAIVTALFSVLGFLSGLPWGPVGVAAGAGLSLAIVCVPLTCWGATRAGPVKLGDFLKAIVPFLAAGSVTFGVLLALSKAGTPFGEFGTMTVAFAAAYAIFGLCLSTMKSGRTVLLEALQLPRILKGDTGAATASISP